MREIDKTLPKDQRILLAAEEVFSRRGYVQATLDEISLRLRIQVRARSINISAIRITYFIHLSPVR